MTRGAEVGRNHLFPKSPSPTVFAFASEYPAPSAATLDVEAQSLSDDTVVDAIVLARHGADACVIGGIAVVHQNILSHSLATH